MCETADGKLMSTRQIMCLRKTRAQSSCRSHANPREYIKTSRVELRSLLAFLNFSHPFLFSFFPFLSRNAPSNRRMAVILSIQTTHLRTKEMPEADEEQRNSSPEGADGTTVAAFTSSELSAPRKPANICLQLLSAPFDSTCDRR